MKKMINSLITGMLFFTMFLYCSCIKVNAQDTELTLEGELYTFGENSEYDLDTCIDKEKIITGTDYGALSLVGNLKEIESVNGFKSYEVISGNIHVNYELDKGYINAPDDAWHIVNDKTKSAVGEKLDEKIQSGAVIVQSSFDGVDWITDVILSDVQNDNTEALDDFYASNEIQLINGCYYQVMVVYKKGILVDKKAINSKYDYLKCAEIYRFYLEDRENKNVKNTSASVTPRKQFSEVVSTKHDKGFDLETATSLDKTDPHFGHEIGFFTINGYTSEAKELDGTDVFLKTAGDEVTLWFSFNEGVDINNLNGHGTLSISDDKNGYDKNFQVNQEKEGFKKGALIVKYTDDEGNVHTPVVYEDFLRANTKTGADTRIKLYQEGEYEVALDYELKDTRNKLPIYTDYKVTFQFSIRNGNTMVYPMDLKAPYSELKDEQYTEKGFKVDLANSKYLKVSVVREALNINPDGTISLDVRENTTSKDNGTFNLPGKYLIRVENQYSNSEPTLKTIYVGPDKYLKALSLNRYSVDEFNEKVRQGYIVDDDGLLTLPAEALEETVNDEHNTEFGSSDETDTKTSSANEDSDNENVFQLIKRLFRP